MSMKMRAAKTPVTVDAVLGCASHLCAPHWVLALTAGRRPTVSNNSFDVSVSEGTGSALVTLCLRGAVDLDGPTFERRVTEAYQTIRSVLSTLRSSQPVRLWNHLPAIHQRMDSQRDRYMVFNSARYNAMTEWFGGSEQLAKRLPAASGVGHAGDELVIHCLAFDGPGVAVENPRQIPAFHYSKRYGPLPPCFSRATVVDHPLDGTQMLLVAGTASIRGEVSVHGGDVKRQLDETLSNLRAVVRVVRESVRHDMALTLFDEIRVYYVLPDQLREIEAEVRQAFGESTRIEMVQAQLCRSELLVEIEGVARLSTGSQS
jgi:chorismate lyase/3-hydroxybenzoate synthase